MTYTINEQNYLQHHGIKGQKWGVRRYQNTDGTLTAAGRNRYNYQDSDKYKNASSYEKGKMNNTYIHNTVMYGKKAANRIEYKVNEKNMDRKTVTNIEKIKSVAKGAAIFAGASAVARLSPSLIMSGSNAVKEMLDARLALNNMAVNAFAVANNIPTASKVKYGLGLNALKTGKEVADRLLKTK